MNTTQQYPKPRDAAFADVKKALAAIGTVIETGTFSARARTWRGWARVKIQVWVLPLGDASSIVVEAESEAVGGAGAKSFVRRFFEALKHSDAPDFTPRRNGLTSMQITLGLAVFVALLVNIMVLTDKSRSKPATSQQHYTPERFGWELGTTLLSKATRDGGTTAMFYFGQTCRTENPTVREYSEAEFQKFQNGLYRAYQSWKTGGLVPPPE